MPTIAGESYLCNKFAMSTLQTIDWVILVIYLSGSIGIGLWMRRYASEGIENYFVAGRKVSGWLIGTSMVATTFAADTPLVVTGWVRDSGIWKNWLWWCYAIGGMMTVFLFARYWRRGDVMTTAELSTLRYGGKSAGILRGFLGGVLTGNTGSSLRRHEGDAADAPRTRKRGTPLQRTLHRREAHHNHQKRCPTSGREQAPHFAQECLQLVRAILFLFVQLVLQ